VARARFQNLPEVKQLQLFEATGRELAAHGYEKASLNRILEQVGLSKGAAYYYFEDKDDLLGTVMQYYVTQLLSASSFDWTSLTIDNYWSNILEVVRHFMDQTHQNPWVVSATRAMLTLPPDRRSRGTLGEAWNTLIDWLRRLVLCGRDLGAVRQDLPEELLISMAIALDEACDRWLMEHWEELGADEVGRIMELLFGIWRKILEPERGKP